MASIGTVYRKLRRAEKYLDILEGELSTYDESAPWAGEWEIDPKDRSQVLRLRVFREPDPEMEITVGEIVYQLRTSLDHLVTQLVALNGGDPENHSGGFPICRDQRDYWEKTIKSRGHKVSRRNLLLEGVAPKHRTMIDSLQPYNQGKRMARYDPLAVLNDLCNGDKHRDVHPAILVRRDSVLTVGSAQAGALLMHEKRIEGPTVRRKPLHDGAEMFRFSFTPANGSAPDPMDLEGAFTLGVCFGSRQVFVFDLRRIFDYVETKVIARFSPEFI